MKAVQRGRIPLGRTYINAGVPLPRASAWQSTFNAAAAPPVLECRRQLLPVLKGLGKLDCKWPI